VLNLEDPAIITEVNDVVNYFKDIEMFLEIKSLEESKVENIVKVFKKFNKPVNVEHYNHKFNHIVELTQRLAFKESPILVERPYTDLRNYNPYPVKNSVTSEETNLIAEQATAVSI